MPWRPSDIEQREGRILRQFNQNEKVQIFRYVTEGSFDGYSWQVLENKQKFISQIMTSRSPVRSCEDIDETALTYAEVKALAAGNPYIREKMELDVQVSKLKLMKANHTSQRYRLEDDIATRYPKKINAVRLQIECLEADIEVHRQNRPADKDDFKMLIGDKIYTDKKEAGAVLLGICRQKASFAKYNVVGEYRGFRMEVARECLDNTILMNLIGKGAYRIEIGDDLFGNITRINNALEGLPKRLAERREQLGNAEKQLETARVEVEKPFEKEQELSKKLERLAELNAMLNMDEKGDNALFDEEEERQEDGREIESQEANQEQENVYQGMENYEQEDAYQEMENREGESAYQETENDEPERERMSMCQKQEAGTEDEDVVDTDGNRKGCMLLREKMEVLRGIMSDEQKVDKTDTVSRRDEEFACKTEQGYFALQETEGGYDYTFYDDNYLLVDGGVYENPYVSIWQAAREILEEEGIVMEDCAVEDYEKLMEKAERVNMDKCFEGAARCLESIEVYKRGDQESTEKVIAKACSETGKNDLSTEKKSIRAVLNEWQAEQVKKKNLSDRKRGVEKLGMEI